MALGGMTCNGQTTDVSSLRFEIMRLKELLGVKEGELQSLAAQLATKDAELEARREDSRDTRLEADVDSLRVQLDSTRKQLDSTRKQLQSSEQELEKLRREAPSQKSSDVDLEAINRLAQELRRSQLENSQLREHVEQLSKDKAEAVAKARSMDSKIMHAAAEAELTRMGHGGVVDGWSTSSVVLISALAAAAGGLAVSYLKKSA